MNVLKLRLRRLTRTEVEKYVDEIMDIFTKGTKNNEGINREVFAKMVKDADDNGDGEISFQEFKTIMKKFLN